MKSVNSRASFKRANCPKKGKRLCRLNVCSQKRNLSSAAKTTKAANGNAPGTGRRPEIRKFKFMIERIKERREFIIPTRSPVGVSIDQTLPVAIPAVLEHFLSVRNTFLKFSRVFSESFLEVLQSSPGVFQKFFRILQSSRDFKCFY